MVRTDPMIRFDWGTAPAGPALPSNNLMVQWDGFVTAPPNGSYTFGFNRDNGAALFINGTSVLNQYTNDYTVGSTVSWDTAPGLITGAAASNAPQPIRVQYFNGGGPAKIELWVKGTYKDANNVTQTLAPGPVDPAGSPNQ